VSSRVVVGRVVVGRVVVVVVVVVGRNDVFLVVDILQDHMGSSFAGQRLEQHTNLKIHTTES